MIKHYPIILPFILFTVTAFGQLSVDLQKSTNLLNASVTDSPAKKAKILNEVIGRLTPYTSENADLRTLVSSLELERDLLRFQADPLTGTAGKAIVEGDRATRQRLLKHLRAEMVDRASNTMAVAGTTKMSAQDAERILGLLKSASQGIDDLNDPSIMGAKAGTYTTLLDRANGVAKLVSSIEDPEAKRIMSALSSTLGTMETNLKHLGVSVPNSLKAFDIPAEIAASVVDTSRKGMDQTSAALNDVAKAIGGDASALARLPDHAKKIETTLSQESYGRAMMQALTDRLADRIPFVRTLAKWSEPAPRKGRSINWYYTADGGAVGDQLTYQCPANGALFPDTYGYGTVGVWGTDRYTGDSRVCAAAVHAGLISLKDGGIVTIVIQGSADSFEASSRNGVTTGKWRYYRSSFVFAK